MKYPFAFCFAAARHIVLKNRRVALWVGIGLACTLGEVQASTIYVPNSSFESQPTPFADPRIDSWQKGPQPGTFDTNVFGAWENLAGVFMNAAAPSPDHIDNADGNQLAYLFAYPQVALFQDYNSTDWANAQPSHAFNYKFEVGKSYRLTVGLTSSRQQPLTQGSTLQLSLYYRDALSNMVAVALTTVTYDTNVFTNITHLLDFQVIVPVVQSNQPWAGQNIGIQMISTVGPAQIGGVWDLENVRLSEFIVIPNFSFELQQTPFADPRVDSWQKAAQPPTFDTNIFGAWENLAGVFQNPGPLSPGHIDNAESNQLAYLFGYPQVALFQDFDSTDWSNTTPTHAFNAVFKAGRGYRLTVALTSSTQQPLTPGSTLQLRLYYRNASSNAITVAATTVTFDTNVFTNLTHLIDFETTVPEVHSTDPWAGQHIGIGFESIVPPNLIGGVWDLENVRLTEVVAAELSEPNRTGGQFRFNIQSEPGLKFEILAGTNVTQPAATWSSIGTVTNTTGLSLFTDPGASLDQRFYRARLLP